MCENVRVENYQDNFFYRITKSSCPSWSNEMESTCCFGQTQIFKVRCLRSNRSSSSYLSVKNLDFCTQHDGDQCFKRTVGVPGVFEKVGCEYDSLDESMDSSSSSTNPVVTSVLFVAIGMLVLMLVYFVLKTWCVVRRERRKAERQNNPVLGVEALPTVYPLSNVSTTPSTPVVLELEEVVLESEDAAEAVLS